MMVLGGLVLALAGCYVPGTYFSNDTIKKNTYKADGKQQHIQVIRIDQDWLAKHKKDPPYSYKIGSYDVLNVIVWDHPELTTPTTQLANPEQTGILVDEKGYIFFPFVGRLEVAGLTLPQIQWRLEKHIRKYIRQPQISVRVVAFRSKDVSVVGEVKKSGSQPITDKSLSVMQAIDAAGGLNSTTANTQNIYILREKGAHILVYWFNAQDPTQLVAANHFLLQNKDLVYVPPAGISGWNRVISQVLPSVGGVGNVQTVVE